MESHDSSLSSISALFYSKDQQITQYVMENSVSLIFLLHTSIKQGWRIIRENVLKYEVEIVKVLNYKLLLEVACPFTEYNVTVLYFQTLYKTLQCSRYILHFLPDDGQAWSMHVGGILNLPFFP